MMHRPLFFLLIGVDVVLAVGLAVFFSMSGEMPEEQAVVIVALAVLMSMVFSGIVILLFFLPARRMHRLKQNGMPAWAEILEEPEQKLFGSVESRGMGGYTHVAVRVQRSDMLPYEASMNAELMAVPYLKPGMRVQVRCDPRNTRNIVLVDTVKDIVERNG